MAGLQPVRGTHDLLPDDMRRHRHVAELARAVASRYGFEEIATPIFEFTDVFARTLGETSDIVTKEMYSFEDKGGEFLTLRPEGTAGVARAFISNGLAQNLPLKVFYRGPMFRRERPQKGRQRQFHQVGIELLGVEKPLADAEVIAMAADFLGTLGLAGKVVCEINTLGDAESRDRYRANLVEYFSGFRDRLSEDSRARLEKNPLRILDSKDEGDRAVVTDAPLIGESLTDDAKAFFDETLRGLNLAGVPYQVNPKLVRGLDYYCHTAFEFTTTHLGSQGTVLAGGRYDGLIQQMGGPPTPGIGWAAGVERLAMLVEGVAEAPRPVAVVPVGPEAQDAAFLLALELRRAGLVAELGHSGNLKKRLQRADKVKARAALILGGDELARGTVVLRDMSSGDQTEIPLAEAASRLRETP
ncbi:MAG: histidine--tRNA ligase [Magnetospirillum sp. WYHS-4]